MWGTVKSLHSLQPLSNARATYPEPHDRGNRFIYAKISGGFEKIRTSIPDLVVMARLLNVALVNPEIQESSHLNRIRDITRRTFMSRFSAPTSSILGFLQISLFSYQNGQFLGENDADKCKDELMAATNTWLTKFNGERTFSPVEGEDIGIWILACTFSNSNGYLGCQLSNCHKSPGTWRLGLLVNNMVILETSYPRS